MENIDIDWEEIILKLESFTRSLVEKKAWFRGKGTTSYLKGKEVEDYVFDAIEKYLRNPDKYDPERGTLVKYLQYNLIRSLVSNDSTSLENQSSKDVFSFEVNMENVDENTGSYIDSIFPCVDAFFDQNIDYNEILKEIEENVSKDKIVEEIYFGERFDGMKRAEIIKEFNMTDKEFDNGKRRMQTILNNVAKKYNLNKQ